MIKNLLLTILLTSTIFATNSNIQNKELSTKDMKKQAKYIVDLAAKELSKTLPQTIDKYTKLITIKADDITLVYIYEINTAPKSDSTVQKEDHSRMKEAVTIGVCRNSVRFLDAGVSIRYIYNSSNSKKELFQFNIKQENCVK